MSCTHVKLRWCAAQHAVYLGILLSSVIAILSSPVAILATAILCVALLALHRVPITQYKASFLTINAFSAFLLITMPWTYMSSPNIPTNTIYLGWHIGLQIDNFCLAGLLIIKSNCILSIFITYFGSLSIGVICQALRNIHVPTKFLTLLLLVNRHIVTLRREAKQIYSAAKLRGFVPRSSWQSYKITTYLIGMLFIRCYDATNHIGNAMILRGFAGHFPLLLPDIALPQKGSYWYTGSLILICVGILIINHLG